MLNISTKGGLLIFYLQRIDCGRMFMPGIVLKNPQRPALFTKLLRFKIVLKKIIVTPKEN